jgi:putative FmdB family regulatory protein
LLRHRGRELEYRAKSHVEVPMPQYEFLCQDCYKKFSLVLSLSEYEKGGFKCPHCGSKNVQQQWAAFYAVTGKKS